LAIRYPITLSTTEPNNNIGLLKIRQADEETQTLVVEILEHGVPLSYEGLQVFFCARIGQTDGLGIIEQKLYPKEMTGPKNGKLEYTMRAEDWQILGRQFAYFSFRKMVDDHTFVQQFTTRDFIYEVTKNVFSDGSKQIIKDGSTYVWTIEDLIRLFNEYIASGKSDWEEFVEQNKEIIESVDPGGVVLTELINARKPIQGTAFPTLSERLNHTDAVLETVEKFPVLEYEKTYVVDSSYSYDNLRRYGIKEDDGSTAAAVSNYQCMKNFMEIQQEGKEYFLNSYGRFTFKGEEGFTFEKPVKLKGIGDPRLFFDTDDGNAFTFLARYTFISGFDITNLNSTKGTGVRFIPSSGYNAYCQCWDNKCTGFSIGFYGGDCFDMSFRNCLGRDCNIGFRMSNVTTMLNSQNCYALRCNIGHSYDKCYYSTIVNIACDQSTVVPYLFSDMHSTIVTSLGQENNKNSIRIDNSDMTFFGVTGDGNNVDTGYGSMMTISGGSKVTLIGGIERRLGDTNSTGASIVVDATSTLSIDNTKLLLDIHLAAGGQIDGVYRVNNVENRYERGKKISFGSVPPTSGYRRLGDIHYNDNISMQSNPVRGWICVAAGTPGDWRPFGFLPNRGALENRPTLNGWNHLGYKYLVFAIGVPPYEITWNGSNWMKNDGTVI